MLAMPTTANASFSSKKSTSDKVRPACLIALGIAREGDVVKFDGAFFFQASSH
jgi:hypothetical protein